MATISMSFNIPDDQLDETMAAVREAFRFNPDVDGDPNDPAAVRAFLIKKVKAWFKEKIGDTLVEARNRQVRDTDIVAIRQRVNNIT